MASSDEEDFAALFAATEQPSKRRERPIAAGDVVRGRVIAVGATSAFVAVGGKAEAQIDVSEFRDSATGEINIEIFRLRCPRWRKSNLQAKTGGPAAERL